MLAETTLNRDSPQFNLETTRSKRLADVKRGAEYYKKLDNIAEVQWKSNVPRFPVVQRNFSSLPKITTSMLSEPDSNFRHSTLMTSTPRQSMSMMSGQSSMYSNYVPPPHSHVSLSQNMSRIIYHRDSVMDSPLEAMPEAHDTRENPIFNPWGTSHSPLEDQTALTPKDLEPKELPFHFRDSKRITPKPIPKKSLPMSRCAGLDRDRHQRTMTNFRSRNGTIRIIRPLDPLPEIEKYQRNVKTETFDIENIEREKTFMMLERIDKILHPNKKAPRTNLGSSEEEIPGTADSSVTLTGDVAELHELRDSMNAQPSQRKSMRSPQVSPQPTPTPRFSESSFKSKRERTRSSLAPIQRPPRIRFNDDPFKQKPKTFADILQSLELSLEDPDAKCQAWIQKCIKESELQNSRMGE